MTAMAKQIQSYHKDTKQVSHSLWETCFFVHIFHEARDKLDINACKHFCVTLPVICQATHLLIPVSKGHYCPASLNSR